MPPGSNSIETRQRTEELFRSDDPLGPSGTFSSDVKLVAGYATVSFLVFSDRTFRLRVEESCEFEGPFVETHRFNSTLNESGTHQHLCRRIAVCGAFMRVFVDNTAGGGAAMSQLELCGLGIPISDITDIDITGSTEVTIVGPGGSPAADVRNADADDDFAAILNGLVTNSRLAIFDGTDWNRLEGGADNAVAPSPGVGAFVGGVVTSPLDVFADGDVSLLHFDTSGRLHVVSTGGGAGVTDTDDDSIAPGQITALEIDLGYAFDGAVWRRENVRSVSGAISESLMHLLTRSAVTGLDESAAVGSQNVPVEARNADADDDFFMARVGLVVNSRTAALDPTGDFVRVGGSEFSVADGLPSAGWIGLYTHSVTFGVDTSGVGTPLLAIEGRDLDANTDVAAALIGLLTNSRLAALGAADYERLAGRNADADADFDESLFGLLTNSRLAARTGDGSGPWTMVLASDAVSVQDATVAAVFVRSAVSGLNTTDVANQNHVIHARAALLAQAYTLERLLVDSVTRGDDGTTYSAVAVRNADADTDFAQALIGMLVNSRNSIHDGTDWNRWEGGPDNAVAPAPGVGAFVGGTVTSPLDVFADGDVSLLHFDTSGRLHVVSTGGGAGVTDTDDDGIAVGQTTSLVIPIPYFSNLDNAGIWERWTGRNDDNALPAADASPTTIGQDYIFDGTNWIRQMGAASNAVAPASPQGAFTVGVVRTSFDVFAAGDAFVPQGTVDGAQLDILRTQEPYEMLLSQATIAAGATVDTGAHQQNSLFAGSLGRTVLQGMMHYDGAASSVSVNIQTSADAGVTWITLMSYLAISGTTLVIQNFSVAMGNRVRVQFVNNDGVNGTGTTNRAFYLTHG